VKNVVVPEFQKRFTISWDELAGVGSSISFLKRKILKKEKGLAFIPGKNAEKVIKPYEDHF
jgi:IMP cyclohydrolase